MLCVLKRNQKLSNPNSFNFLRAFFKQNPSFMPLNHIHQYSRVVINLTKLIIRRCSSVSKLHHLLTETKYACYSCAWR